MVTKRTRYAPSRRKRTTPRDRDLLPLPFARVSPDTPGAWGSSERGNNQEPVAGELVVDDDAVADKPGWSELEHLDDGTMARAKEEARANPGKAVALQPADTERFTVELPGFEVECVRHLDRPRTWIIGVWPAERSGSTHIRGACTIVDGVPRGWRGDIDRENQAVVARAVCIAIDEREKGGAT